MKALAQVAQIAGQKVSGGSSRGSAALWSDVLREVPLFADVSGRHLRAVARLGTIARYEAGEPVVVEGGPGDAFFVVLDGAASVQIGNREVGATLGAGSTFGEMALLDGAPRSATVRADTELTCLRLGRKQFLGLLRSEPSISLALLGALAARVRALQAE